MASHLPENFHPLDPKQPFSFACHPKVTCFTECCQQLDLPLTPYDVLRLKNRLQLHSGKFLEQYVIVEWDDRVTFPQCYLTMVDDGQASCAFISPEGCTVYEDRPGACRAYPVGRGAARKAPGEIEECFVLIKEPHCRGFAENTSQAAEEYFTGQGLEEYNRYNDKLIAILQHEKIIEGYRLSRPQLDQFLLALYNLDMFRREMSDDRISMNRPLTTVELQGLAGDDNRLLLLSIAWLQQELFDNNRC